MSNFTIEHEQVLHWDPNNSAIRYTHIMCVPDCHRPDTQAYTL